MGSESGKRISVPAKIMAGLAVCVALGLGLCGIAADVSSRSDNATAFFVIAGSICFFGGIAALILFGVGWLIAAIAKSLFEKKD